MRDPTELELRLLAFGPLVTEWVDPDLDPRRDRRPGRVEIVLEMNVDPILEGLKRASARLRGLADETRLRRQASGKAAKEDR